MKEDEYTPFTIYIVDKTLHGPETWKNHLYCTPEDILSGGYRQELAGTVLSAGERWKRLGLASIAFDKKKTDVRQLKAYLADAEDVDLLGLYVPYFSDAFASEEEISMAQTAARLLCEHVIREHGGSMLAEDACMDCRQELLDELGVDRTYTDLFGDFDSGYVYRSSEEYPLVVTTPRGDTFNIVPLPGDMETPAGVCRLLYEAWEGPQVILEAVRAEAPEYADILEKNYSEPFICTLAPNRNGSKAFSWGNSITLGFSGSIVHEIVHLLVPSKRFHYMEENWKYEAAAEYFELKYYPGYLQRSNYYKLFLPPCLGVQKAPQIYLFYADFPQTADELDIMLFTKADVAADYAVWSTPENHPNRRSIAKVYQNQGSGELPLEGGNELAYNEAATFADYLIENYSLSTFLEYCLDPDTTFEDVYGIDYETAEAAWMEDLIKMGEKVKSTH